MSSSHIKSKLVGLGAITAQICNVNAVQVDMLGDDTMATIRAVVVGGSMAYAWLKKHFPKIHFSHSARSDLFLNLNF